MKLSDVVLVRGRVSDQIKEALKQAILNGEFKPGDKLPREDQIAATLKVSMVSVREALRDLEGAGIVKKRRGIFGGNFVAQPSLNEMNDLMADYCQFGTATAEELMDCGLMLEPALVSFAANRRTEKDMEKIRANIEEREEALASGKLGILKIAEFHRIIAACCKNQLLSAIVQALINVSIRIANPPLDFTREDAEAHLRYSKELYDCMVRQDKSAAQKAMVSMFKRYMEIRQRSKK
jgi:GntR family transcriptional regulator, transcriptional repressor for pyruvate dehydrogenase complex